MAIFETSQCRDTLLIHFSISLPFKERERERERDVSCPWKDFSFRVRFTQRLLSFLGFHTYPAWILEAWNLRHFCSPEFQAVLLSPPLWIPNHPSVFCCWKNWNYLALVSIILDFIFHGGTLCVALLPQDITNNKLDTLDSVEWSMQYDRYIMWHGLHDQCWGIWPSWWGGGVEGAHMMATRVHKAVPA